MSEADNPRRDTCMVVMEFRLPRSGVGLLYGDTSPWLRVDRGERQNSSGWETRRLSLAPGKHRFEVGVPHHVFGTIGQAGRTVRMAAGDEVRLVYQAPSSPGAIGEVLFPWELSDADAPWASVVVSVAVLVAVLCLAYGIFR